MLLPPALCWVHVICESSKCYHFYQLSSFDPAIFYVDSIYVPLLYGDPVASGIFLFVSVRSGACQYFYCNMSFGTIGPSLFLTSIRFEVGRYL